MAKVAGWVTAVILALGFMATIFFGGLALLDSVETEPGERKPTCREQGGREVTDLDAMLYAGGGAYVPLYSSRCILPEGY